MTRGASSAASPRTLASAASSQPANTTATVTDTESNSTCSCVCDAVRDHNSTQQEDQSTADDVVRLKFLTGTFGTWFEPVLRDFEKYTNGAVQVDLIPVEFSQLYSDIINDAAHQLGLYHGYLTPPVVTGSVVEYNGWADLTPFIQETAAQVADWSDIMLGYRQYVAQYEDQIIMYPLDGDILTLYYRRDVLEAFNLTVPRTWDEYGQVAAATHGKVYGNQTLIGSCIGWVSNCAGAYWANLLVSSMTQYEGPWSGHLFDTANMKPLAGPAMAQALEWLETQVMYGPDDQFDGCIDPINSKYMMDGSCVLSYNWGNLFKNYLQPGSELRGKLGIAPTPGSRQVLDRSSGLMKDCDEVLCPYGTTYADIGRVNAAPYLAFGGWACAVNNYNSDDRIKRWATELCAFASSRKESVKNIIPNATEGTINAQDPFRASLLDLQDYVGHGYEQEVAQMYIRSIQSGLGSRNVVTDIRFPTATEINQVLDEQFHNYLNATKRGYIADSDRAKARAAVVDKVVTQWKEIIASYDADGSTKVGILETYQRLRGVYVKNTDLNQLGAVRWVGYSLGGMAMIFACSLAVWTIQNRGTPVVRASQPLFLVMICIGTFVFASSIFPMGIDDEIASVSACDTACMAVPWLLTNGWVIIFSAIYAKLRRVNLVYKNSREFKRLKVTEKDVIWPFALLFASNLTFLLIWTIVDPLVWNRHPVGPTASRGFCATTKGSAVWKVCAACIYAANGLALLMANVEAYKARHVSTEYGESNYIAMVTAFILQIVLVGLPLLFLMNSSPSAEFFVEMSIAFMTSMSILLFIFVPKIHSWWTKPNERKRSVTVTGVGLSFRVYTEEMAKTEEMEREIRTYKRKLDDLALLLRADGIDADYFYQKAGFLPKSSPVVGEDVASSQHQSSLAPTELSKPPSAVGAEPSLPAVSEADDEGDVSSSAFFDAVTGQGDISASSLDGDLPYVSVSVRLLGK